MSVDPELSHGRIETRAVRLIPVTPAQVNFPCIRSVAEVRRQSTTKKTSQKTRGNRIYLSSRDQDPPESVLDQIRLRWNVENKNHHHRDATFHEDKCRCRTGNTAANLALLRGAVLNIWKTTRPDQPAPAFIQGNQRKLDAMITTVTKNQQLGKMQ